MNQIDKKKLIKKAKRKFVKHTWLYISVKKKASVPYEKSFFHKLVSDSKKPLCHKDYLLYIHDNYLTIRANGFIFEPIKVPLDDKVWIELYCIFNLKGISLMQDTDDEPI